MSQARRAAAAAESPPPSVYELRLAEGTPGEAFERVARAVDEGRVSITEAKVLADILERRLRVMDAERFRLRLELAEATARAAAMRTALPASRATVDAPRPAEDAP